MNEIFFYSCLFIFGTLFGSFWSVLIYRLKSWEKWILNGRSHCPKCNTTLQAKDLVPIFSWLKNLWKCWYCKNKISPVYPFLEICTGLLFMWVWYFLIDIQALFNGGIQEYFVLLFWLIIAFISILYIFYDLLFLEIHEGMMATGIGFMIVWVIAQMQIPGLVFFDNLPSEAMSYGLLAIWMLIISIILIWAYIIMNAQLDEKYDIWIIFLSGLLIYFGAYFTGIEMWNYALTSWLIAAVGIFLFFFLQIFISKWAWLGWGDLRIALMIGFGLWMSLWFAGMMLTYILWSFISIFYLIFQRIKNKGAAVETQIPFGPFLALWFFSAMFFQNEIQNFISLYI